MQWYFHTCCLHTNIVTALENKNYLPAVHKCKMQKVQNAKCKMQKLPTCWLGPHHLLWHHLNWGECNLVGPSFAVGPQPCRQTVSDLQKTVL